MNVLIRFLGRGPCTLRSPRIRPCYSEQSRFTRRRFKFMIFFFCYFSLYRSPFSIFSAPAVSRRPFSSVCTSFRFRWLPISQLLRFSRQTRLGPFWLPFFFSASLLIKSAFVPEVRSGSFRVCSALFYRKPSRHLTWRTAAGRLLLHGIRVARR